MAIERLSTVEIGRMNKKDLNIKQPTILIHSKGKKAMIYPRLDTFVFPLRYR